MASCFIMDTDESTKMLILQKCKKKWANFGIGGSTLNKHTHTKSWSLKMAQRRLGAAEKEKKSEYLPTEHSYGRGNLTMWSYY